MKRKQLHHSSHPFNPQPFEAFWSGSWKPVEQLSIIDGSITTHIADEDGKLTEEIVPMANLRVRSREATWSDCLSFLRPGIDVCVFSNADSVTDTKPVWLDARIRSIERKPHGESCTCRFHVSFYVTQGPDMFSENKKLSKQTSTISLDRISVIQNLEQKPFEGEYFRWSSTEDCSSVHQLVRFIQGKFCADLTWLLVASVLKRAAFVVKLINNRVVYEISESDGNSYAVSFKVVNEVLTPVVVEFVPDKDNLPEGSEGGESLPSYDVTGLRRSTRRCVRPERYLGCDNPPDYEIEVTRIGGSKPLKTEHEKEESQSDFDEEMPSKKQNYRRASDFRMPKDDLEDDVSEMFSDQNEKKPFDFFNLGSGGGGGGRRKGSSRKFGRKRECFYVVRESVYGSKSFGKGSTSARACRELIQECMVSIDETLKNKTNHPPVVEQWEEFQAEAKKTEEEGAKPEENPEPVDEEEEEEEISDIDRLWTEMDLSMASWYLLDDTEDHVQPKPDTKTSSRNECRHDYTLDEQVGTICRFCGFVETEIRDILPPFASSAKCTISTKEETNEEGEPKTDIDQYSIPAPPSVEPDQETNTNVWSLIPDLGNKLRPHQRKAFEFLWRNIAGSTTPSRMEDNKARRGGCVISHTPGAGKTLLIISFLVSYLKLFPGSRPLVLAPKTTLYTWYKELVKWRVSVPVHRIHGRKTFTAEVMKFRRAAKPGSPRNHDVLHVLDCLEKMKEWLARPSILLMGYPSFLTMTREDSEYEHRKYMAQILNKCPGILILDEGHNPRSTKSRLRKGLMKVETRLRVLLSGTLFQNNFGEYYNTLCLARPSFANEVLNELDPKYDEERKTTRFSLENRGRKLLLRKISDKIESNEGEERAEALKTLKKLTSDFIDVYEGGDSEAALPGMQSYTIMMKLTSLQQEVLSKLKKRGPVHSGYPLELELLITLAAIHPYLIKSTACSAQYLTRDELEWLDSSRLDVKSGSKVRFVMGLVPRCVVRNEKVLIFCHNIAPINLLVEVFERFYGWRRGREVLVLQGDMELFERGRVIDEFESGESRVMIASITACAEGISLTAASRVVLIDSEWNPSKSKQAIARAFRPGQRKVVYVYQLLGKGTLEEEKHGRTTWKEWVSNMIFSEEEQRGVGGEETGARVEDELLREMVEEDRGMMFHKIMKNEKASSRVLSDQKLL